jgi:1-phosphofructokinase
MYLTLTLNPSIDYYVRFPSGKTLVTGSVDAPAVNRSSNESFEAGGKGINVAKILSRLNEASGSSDKVTASGFSADFTGKELISSIESEGLVSGFIEVTGHTRINLKITDGLGLETEINGSGPSIGPGDITRLINSLKDKDFDTLFISGSLPSSCASDTYALIMTAVLNEKPHTRFVVDCEGEALMNCLPYKPFLIKPNAYELSKLVGVDISTSSSPDLIFKAAKKLQSKGARNVLVSLGAEGACLLTEDKEFLSVAGMKGDVVSTIGAGDTMIASFIFMADRSGDMAKALKFANECAARSAFTAGLPDMNTLKDILKNY